MVNQTPSTPLELDNESDLPPSYEDAVAAPSNRTSGGGQRPNQLHPQPIAHKGPPSPSLSQRFPPSPNPQHPPAAGPSNRPPQPPPGIARQFPPAFSVYSDGWGRSFTIGEHQQAPIYAVRLHSGFSSNPPVVLHTGPNADTSPMLAAVDFEPWSGDMTVSLPPLPGRGPAASEVRVEAEQRWHRVYRFPIEVGSPAVGMRLEMFEWRHSYGDAIAGLGGAVDGWKLVRMDSRPPPGVAGAFVPGGALTSDGKEVVAVWSDATMSMSKRAKFAFLGTGLSGFLGERWAVMVVTSALGIWERRRRQSRNRRT